MFFEKDIEAESAVHQFIQYCVSITPDTCSPSKLEKFLIYFHLAEKLFKVNQTGVSMSLNFKYIYFFGCMIWNTLWDISDFKFFFLTAGF